MKLYPHQRELASRGAAILEENNFLAIVAEPRTGKTRVAITLASGRVLVLTKKNAIVGWNDELREMGVEGWTVTNYEQAKKLNGDDYDMVVLDEAHKVSKIGKPSQIANATKALTIGKKVILVTATPSSESLGQWFAMLDVANAGPWTGYKNFYKWFKDYGVPSKIRLNGHDVETYKKYQNDSIYADIGGLCLTMTKKEADTDFIEANEKIITYSDEKCLELCAEIKRDNIIEFRGMTVKAETPASLMCKQHQIIGGTIKQTELVLDDKGNVKEVADVRAVSSKRVKLVSQKFGSMKKVVVFCNYVAERDLLRWHLKGKATEDYLEFRDGDAQYFIGQIKSWSEGVSFKFADAIVMYSINFSATTWIQARDRLCAKDREDDADVYIILCDGGIDKHVYEAVSQKKDFTLNYYRRLK